MKKFYVPAVIIVLALLGFAVKSLLFHQDHILTDEGDFKAKLVSDEYEFIFNTDSYYVSTFSSYSIYAVTDHARCGIHITNISGTLNVGSYTIGSQNSISPMITCVADNPYQRERIDSVSGEITILDISENRISGYFDVEMSGAVTGIKYRFSGQFISFEDT